MRRSRACLSVWEKYRYSTPPPKPEGPAPLNTPRPVTKGKGPQAAHDPINDKFPVKIRGHRPLPDVPLHQFVEQTFAVNAAAPFFHELRSYESYAPAGNYRFRPYNDFDSAGREMVEKLRRHKLGEQPFKEAYLSKMNGRTTSTQPTRTRAMERAVRVQHQRVPYTDEVAKQRDVGRVEPPAKAVPLPHGDAFPYTWNAEDWYEYEVANVRMKRFFMENQPSTGSNPSEVTYKLLIGSDWDHHLGPLADDLTSFIRDVARELIEEKLVSVRNNISALASGRGSAVDNELRKAFNLGDNDYDDDEIAAFAKRDLEDLERECARVLGLINSTRSDFTDLSDANHAWPVVEQLEPWRKMVEFWSSRNDVTFTVTEMSTRKYEFRKYFRVIKVKMPFQSMDFERRMYDMRHWLHRRCSVEFQTVMKKNLIHDGGRFPVEPDPANMPTHEDHRMFSYALDWKQAPADFVRSVTAKAGDTFESLAARVGCTASDLRASNPSLRAIVAGSEVTLPRRAATHRLATPAVEALTVELTDSMKTWESAAEAIGVTVEELQAANPGAMASYKDGFDVKSLTLPFNFTGATDAEFATQEPVFVTDTFESVASRLGTSVEALRAVNPGVDKPESVETMRVPDDATKRRRTVHTLSRSPVEAAELFPSLVGARDARKLPTEFPNEPERAAEFPDEFMQTTARLPRQPASLVGTDSWLSYTATYLDPELSATSEPVPQHNVNPAWPAQPVPGTQQQTPFEEDQTWFMSRVPLQKHEMFNPDQHLQDMPTINHEQFPVSVERTAP